ncbi:hypothetical protein TTRE_0000841401 [Trichuris trichiura]|uniref:Uncharacterized protein n=1 Tax=Trichuris trichiura TaxID=36087 RepID=A0A077ZJY3_TRITR|nr:hypothetical protein TTRE_0000841401 [Trichuris trichiura]
MREDEIKQRFGKLLAYGRIGMRQTARCLEECLTNMQFPVASNGEEVSASQREPWCAVDTQQVSAVCCRENVTPQLFQFWTSLAHRRVDEIAQNLGYCRLTSRRVRHVRWFYPWKDEQDGGRWSQEQGGRNQTMFLKTAGRRAHRSATNCPVPGRVIVDNAIPITPNGEEVSVSEREQCCDVDTQVHQCGQLTSRIVPWTGEGGEGKKGNRSPWQRTQRRLAAGRTTSPKWTVTCASPYPSAQQHRLYLTTGRTLEAKEGMMCLARPKCGCGPDLDEWKTLHSAYIKELSAVSCGENVTERLSQFWTS